MQSFYPERFEREMGCTEAEWLRGLPDAIGVNFWTPQANAARVRIGDGALDLTWSAGEPRVIAAVRLPRLLVSFRFTGLDDARRYAFMRRFDLYMLKGGG